ncbi:MAG: ATP synthase subunit I [Kangiellaceae bacterium]
MSHFLVKQGFEQAKKYLIIQAIIIVLVSITALLKDFQIAIALLSGGIAVFVANLYFVLKVFSKSGAQANKEVVRAFYMGEATKIVISLSLLVLAFKVLSGNEEYVLMGYVLAYLLQWIAPSIVKTH